VVEFSATRKLERILFKVSRLFPLVLLTSALLAAPASAETVTVGSPLTGSFSVVTFCSPVCISANTALSEPGAQATVPVDGTVTRWRTIAGSGGAFRIRVLRPDGAGQYVLAGTSTSETPTGPGIDTFTTSLAVKAGDLIGLENLSTAAKIGSAFPSGSAYRVWFGSFAEAASTSSASSSFSYSNQVIGFNVDVERPSIAPPPPLPPAAAQCTVPTLQGKKLKAAKKKIRAAGCKVGEVTKRKGTTAANGRVVAQGPKAGKVVAAGTVVRVTLAVPRSTRSTAGLT
jgi:hypothetical protein